MSSSLATTSHVGRGWTRLNSSGNGINYSTFLGGSDIDIAYAIALDGNVAYITGETDSSDFPLQNNLQNNQTGTDVFVAKIDTSAGTLDFSTYHGGASTDSGRGIAVASSTAYIAGFTNSASDAYSGTFPVAPGTPYQDDVAGEYDCFVAKITP